MCVNLKAGSYIGSYGFHTWRVCELNLKSGHKELFLVEMFPGGEKVNWVTAVGEFTRSYEEKQFNKQPHGLLINRALS